MSKFWREYVVVMLIILVMLVGINVGVKYECDILASYMDIPGDHSWIVGCLVEVEQGWIPIDNYCIIK